MNYKVEIYEQFGVKLIKSTPNQQCRATYSVDKKVKVAEHIAPKETFWQTIPKEYCNQSKKYVGKYRMDGRTVWGALNG